MKLTNEIYDWGKWVVFVFSPSLAVFITGLGELYHWESTVLVVTTINLLTVFIGSILQISSQNYQKNKDEERRGADGSTIN